MTAYSTVVLSCDGDHCLRVHTCPLPPKTIDEVRADARHDNWTCDDSGDFCTFKCSQQPTPTHATCDGDGMLYEDSAGVVGVHGGRIAVADCPGCVNCITATFAAIFARLDAHEQRLDALARLNADDVLAHELRGETIDGILTRLECLEARTTALDERIERYVFQQDVRLDRLEARIAAPVAPESAVTASGAPMEPGNATEAHGHEPWCNASWPNARGRSCNCGHDSEVAAALRMYRKVQGCHMNLDDGTIHDADGMRYMLATFLAWLKEGEA